MSFNGDLYTTDDGLELTSKGQIHTHNASSNVGLGVSGNNDYVLVEDSSTATGLAWKVNAHSSVTPSSTTTFTNKSIDFATNTMTSSLAQLDTALGTTGTASASTFLRGDNSWASASDPNWTYITSTTLGSANSVLELTTGLGDFDATFHTFYLDQSGGSGFGIDFNPYISTGLLNVSLGYTLQLDGGSSEVNGATEIPIIASSTAQNNCCGNFIMYNVNSGAYQGYTFGRFDYCSSLAGTSNSPNLAGQCYYKTASTVDQVGFRFEQTGATSPLFSTAGFVNSWGWKDTS